MTSTSATSATSAAALPLARPGRLARAAPQIIEWLLALAAIALLLPSYERLRDSVAGRDGRYADPGLALQGLPEPVLPAMCAAHGALAVASVRERLCGAVQPSAAVPVRHVPLRLDAAVARVREEMEVFNTINGKAKGLSTSLLDFHAATLAENLAVERPELFVALHLHNEPTSPWYQQLDLGGHRAQIAVLGVAGDVEPAGRGLALDFVGHRHDRQIGHLPGV